MRLLPLVALLAACNPDVNVNKRDIDADGDGYTTDVDCDDAHATVNPDATEVCDGLDNDCDTTVDEDVGDATTWYADADGDGHGDAGAATVACEAPADAVTEADDCDDADATAFPGAAEVCNGTDDDCDGSVDEDAEDVGTFYADADGDGYGDPITAVTACEASPDEVADGTDCDDADAAIHPDAAEADCDDPVDYNCDGSVGYADADGDGVAACEDCDDTDAGRSPLLPEVCDEADTDEDCDAVADTEDPSADPATWSIWYRDGDGDTYGDAASSVAACDLPAGYVTNDDDCDDTSSGVSPADSEVCDAANVDEDCDGAADDSDSAASGKATWYLDADADTYGDAATTTSACDAPSGYVTNDDDCNDTSSGVSPADSEVCDAANVDEDCDGAADDSDTAASGKATWYLDADADTYGVSTTTLSRCDQPSSYVTVSTDCDDVHADAFPGGIEVCGDDVDQDCSGADEECSSTAYDGDYDVEDGDHVKIYGPTTDDWFGEALVGGDFDGDGVGDLVVGSS
ncbi:MAG: putative metal-binding motif-containing protein, partial [Pseudomonadota bacterium]|nr:putative metal-binding motif-containing protein [Pseudomonadota bacterium]